MRTIGFALILIFSGLTAQAQTISYCYGPKCAYDPTYSGPMGNYEVTGGGSADLNQKAYEAYRYGKTRELEAYRQNVENRIVELRAAKAGVKADALELKEMRKQVNQELNRTFPKPPSSVPSQAERRKLNPLPTDSDEAKLQSKVDPVWDKVQKSDALGTVEDLAKLNESLVPIPDVPTAGLDQEFIEKELALSGVTNGQGLVKLPFAKTPDAPLHAAANSYFGVDVRKGINQLLASQSVLGAACAASPQDKAGCAEAQAHLQDAVAGFYLLDHLVEIQGGLVEGATLELFKELQGIAEFSAGVARGMIDGAVGTAQGIYQLVTSPVESIKAMASALVNYEQTFSAIKEVVKTNFDLLVNGDLEQQGRVIGRAVFEIGAMLVPVGELLKATEVGTLVRASLYETVAQVVDKSADLGKIITPFQVRSQLIASNLGLKGAALTEFAGWSKRYLDIADDGVLAITFAKRVTKERFADLMELEKTLGTSVSETAKAHLVRQVTYEQTILGKGQKFTKEQLVSIAKKVDQIDGALSEIPSKAAPTEGYVVTRGMKKNYNDKFGRPRENTPESLFNSNEGGQYSSHRYTEPGQDGLYTTVGTGPDVEQVISQELRSNGEEIIYGTKVYRPERILDLNDPAVIDRLEKIGIDRSLLLKDEYSITQAIGSLAKKHGYDAILAPSAVDDEFINLIILKGGK